MNRIIRENDVTIIELGPVYDSLDNEALAEFEGLVMNEAICCEPARLVLDLTNTSYIGSSFIETLVRAWRRLKERDGVLALCGIQPFCAEVLRVTRLDSLWDIYTSRAEAVAAMTGK
jgi:anti-sigma B factor antagonist